MILRNALAYLRLLELSEYPVRLFFVVHFLAVYLTTILKPEALAKFELANLADTESRSLKLRYLLRSQSYVMVETGGTSVSFVNFGFNSPTPHSSDITSHLPSSTMVYHSSMVN